MNRRDSAGNHGSPRRQRERLGSRVPGELPASAADALDTPSSDATDALSLDDPEQRLLGDFELCELLGEGAVGTVYRARQLSLDREVALKLLSAGPWATKEFVARFKREAAQAARLQHPNIVAVHEIGEQEGLIFYAMDLVTGETMSRMLERRGRLPAREAAALMRTIAEAVDYAHRLGVLHLDLKPGNVLLDANGTPKIADFGLARNLGGAWSITSETVAGTPDYMAPEQAQPQRGVLTPATDVWGLGAMLYECLTGTPPFQGKSSADTLRLLREGRVRRLSRHVSLPADIEAICLKCLNRNALLRYRSARELADDLGNFIEARPVQARPLNALQRLGRWVRREPKLAAVAALAVLAIVVGLVSTARQWRRADAEKNLAQHTLWLQRHETAWRQFESSRGYESVASLAANLQEQEQVGDTVAAERERLRLGLALDQMPLLIDAIDVGATIHTLAMSPDGRLIAVGMTPRQVALYETATGRQRWRVQLHLGDDDDPQLRRLQFTADGRHLIVTRHWRMLQMRPSGMEMRRLDVADGHQTVPPDFAGLSDQTWSEDGRYVLLHRETPRRETQLFDVRDWHALSPPVARADPQWLIAPGARFVASWNDARPTIEIRDPATLRTRHELAASGEHTRFIAWTASPDGGRLALGRVDGEVLLVDPGSGAQRRLEPRPRDAINWLRFSEDGQLLSASANDGSLYVWTVADGALLGQPLHLEDELWGHQIERVGDTVLALAMHWDRVSMWALTGRGERAAAPVQLAPDITHPGYIPRFASAFDPARALLATGGTEGSLRLWRLSPSPLRGVLAPRQREDRLDFDGSHLVAVEGRRLWIVGVDDPLPRGPIMALPQPVGFALLTPDGRSLVATSGREIHVLDWRQARRRFAPIVLDGSPVRMLASADGRQLLVANSDPAGGRALRIQAFALADGRPLGPAARAEVADWALAPDGDHVAIVANGVVSLRRLDALDREVRRLGTPGGDELPQYLAFATDRQELVLLRMKDDPAAKHSDAQTWLERWSWSEGRLVQRIRLEATPKGLSLRERDGLAAISATPGRVTAFRSLSLLLDRDARQRVLPMTHQESLARAQTFSPDGRVLAQALRDGVILQDVDTGTPLGPPMRVPLALPDLVVQLAFSPDGKRLLGRTFLGRWLAWTLQAEPRPVREIAAEAANVAPPPGLPLVPASERLRQDLRARDPGAGAIVVEPLITAWSCLAGERIPPRVPGTPAYLVDLDRYYNRSLHPLGRELFESALGNQCELPAGVQRLRGVDYDIRGRVVLGKAVPIRDASDTATTLRIAPLPVARFSALDLLGFSGEARDLQPGDAIATVRLRYRDGSTEDLPLSHLTQAGPGSGIDPAVHTLAWSGQTPLGASRWPSFVSLDLFSVRLVNPHPDREVRVIELHVLHPSWQGLNVYALTLEPPGVTTAPRQSRR